MRNFKKILMTLALAGITFSSSSAFACEVWDDIDGVVDSAGNCTITEGKPRWAIDADTTATFHDDGKTCTIHYHGFVNSPGSVCNNSNMQML